MDRLVVWIVKILALAARHVGLLISIVITTLLLALVYTVIILGSYESWDKSAVAIASGVISSVITTAFLLVVRWIGTKSNYFSEDILDVLGNILWRKCLWETARARLIWQGYRRYEQQLPGGLMGKGVVIRAIHDSGGWRPQVVVGDDVVYGFGTGDDLGTIKKSRDDALEDAWRFAKSCGISVKIEIREIGGYVLETPTKNMFIVRSLLYRSIRVLQEYDHSKPSEFEQLVGEIEEMLGLLVGAKMYFDHDGKRGCDELVTSLMELIRKTMVALPDYEYGKEPDSDRLVKDLKDKLADLEHDLFSSAKKIVLADSNSRHETRLARFRRWVSEAWRSLWSRLKRLVKRDKAD